MPDNMNIYTCTVVKDNKVVNLYSSLTEREIYNHIENIAKQYINEGAEQILSVRQQYGSNEIEIIYEYIKIQEII